LNLPTFYGVGAGLMESASATLSGTQHGGVTIRITSSNAAALLVSPDTGTPGAPSADIFVADGSSNVQFVVHGVEGASGVVTVTAGGTGFTSDTDSVPVVTPVLRISALSTSFSASAQSEAFTLDVGIPYPGQNTLYQFQAVRAGAAVTAAVASSAPSVGRLETLAGTAASRTVSIAANSIASPSTLGAGGVAFDPVSPGQTVVTATAPGFEPTAPDSSVMVTVSP
jgi:hypothetical protein